MKNRKLLLIVSLVLALTMSLGGTLAYLTDSDADVNVMTVGRVDIVQNEQERNEDGELVAFTQNKPVLPAVYEGSSIPWDAEENWPVAKDQAWKTVQDIPNVVDKFVTVTNKGNTPAYVRTIIAWEVGAEGKCGDYMHLVSNGTNITDGATWTWKWLKNSNNEDVMLTIGGNTYMFYEAVYTEELASKATTIPSLKQVYLDKTATNEIVANYGETFDIIALSQAVQASGFAAADGKTAAEVALNEAFPYVTTAKTIEDTLTEWFTNVNQETTGEGNVPPVFYDHIVDNLDDLKAALTAGGNIQLADDIELDKMTAIEPGKEVYLNLNGKTITVNQNTASNTLFYVKEGAKLVVDGSGTIDLEDVSTMVIFYPEGELVIENGTFTRNEITADEVTNKTTGLFMGVKNSNCNVTINGGYFDPGYYDKNADDIEEILAGTKTLTETEDDKAKRGNSTDANPVRVAVKDNVSVLLNHSGFGTFKVYGGTFVGANPAWGDEGCMLPTNPNYYLRPWSYYQGALLDGQTFNENGIVLPEGYSITKDELDDGRPTYTVTYSK